MPRLFLAAALLASLTGCKSDNPQSCELPGNKNTGACTDAGNPPQPECKTDPDCVGKAGGPVCDTAQNKCVQCTANENKCDANGTAPRCDTTAETCVACVDDNDCSAGAGTCLPTGACAAPETIIHAASAGTDPQPGCGGGAPQKPCSLEDALALATDNPAKKVIRLDDNGTYTPGTANFVVNANIAIEAHTGILARKNDGPILKVTNGKSLTLLGGTVDGAITNGSGDGIACDAGSALAVQGTTIQNNKGSAINEQGCMVTVANTKVQANSIGSNNFVGLNINGGSIAISRSFIVGNKGGGIATSNNASFQIVGNAIINNGGSNSPVGGVTIAPPPTNSTGRLDFNTIAANSSNNLIASGVQCLVGIFTAQNNIIWSNSGTQLNGCSYSYSVIGPSGISGGIDGGHNTSADPKLTSGATDPHLQPGSSALKAANPSADLTGIAAKDIDGDARTAPADVGADQTR